MTERPSPPMVRRLAHVIRRLGLASRRRVLGLVGSLTLVALLVSILSVWHGVAELLDPSVPLLFLVPVLLASAISGPVAGAVVAWAAVLLWDWYITPPLYRLDPFDDPRDGLALLAFLAVAVLVGQLNDAARRREETLRGSESRWRTLLAAAPIGTVMVDAQGRILRVGAQGRHAAVNDAYCALTGYTSEELAGMEIYGLLPPEQREAFRHEFRRMAENVRKQWEMTVITRDGERRTVLANGVTVGGPEGQPERLIFVVDITDRKRAEEALRWANADLSRANAELEQATQAKSAYLATLSHEIRTPMNGVIGLTSLLQDTSLTPQQREYVDAIQASGEALVTLINDILDLSKIEAGQLTLEQRPLDLRRLVREVVGLFAAQARERGLDLRAQIDAAVPEELVGDALRLRQVLANLVGNAIKFTNRGAVKVRVAMIAQDEGGVLLRIAVCDTGIGIAPEARARLFEPFAQADPATARRYGGTGLGLAICKQLVELMGGRIDVESAVGQGSTFWFTLRLPRQVAAAERPPAAPQIGPGSRTAEGAERGRVLVAEDNAINRLVAVGLLQSLGYAVETAEDGRQAVEAVRQGHFDLVLMDAHMPELDGFAATAAIREQERAAGRGRHTPIVALTADAQPQDVEKSLAAGMDDHLTKPVTRERLAAVLERWLPTGAASA